MMPGPNCTTTTASKPSFCLIRFLRKIFAFWRFGWCAASLMMMMMKKTSISERLSHVRLSIKSDLLRGDLISKFWAIWEHNQQVDWNGCVRDEKSVRNFGYKFISLKSFIMIKNTDLFQKGKYHCKADLLLDSFGFEQTSKAVVHSTKAKQLNPNKQNRRYRYSDTFPYEVSEYSLIRYLKQIFIFQMSTGLNIKVKLRNKTVEFELTTSVSWHWCWPPHYHQFLVFNKVKRIFQSRTLYSSKKSFNSLNWFFHQLASVIEL